LQLTSDHDNVISVSGRSWDIQFHPGFEIWANSLAQPDAEALLAALRVLRDEGPALGRPLVDSVAGSRHSNMKELRPGSTGRTEIRALFAFDKKRQAILLVGGDKSDNWRSWYDRNIPIADDRFDEHQAKLVKGAEATANQTKAHKRGRDKR
jgi:hypothetical protein